MESFSGVLSSSDFGLPVVNVFSGRFNITILSIFKYLRVGCLSFLSAAGLGESIVKVLLRAFFSSGSVSISKLLGGFSLNTSSSLVKVLRLVFFGSESFSISKF